MRASFSEPVGHDSGAMLRDPALGKSRPLVVDLDEVLVRAPPFSRNIVSEMARRFKAVTDAVASLSGLGKAPQGQVVTASHFDPADASFDQDAVTFLLHL